MKPLFILLLWLWAVSCTSPPTSDDTYPVGQISTPQGEMLFWLHEETPAHRTNFIELAEQGYWDSLTFNRVIEGFVIQGGCPDTPEGFNDVHYLLAPEFRDSLQHIYGAVGAGRDDNPGKLSAGCQFYIVHDRDGIPRLDGDYTIFGQVFAGWEVLERIATSPTDSLDAPLTDVPLTVSVLYLSTAELKDRGYPLQ